jgi:hypothetical protein
MKRLAQGRLPASPQGRSGPNRSGPQVTVK